MKEILLPSLSSDDRAMSEQMFTFGRFSRRSFVKIGAMGLGVLAGVSTAWAQFPGQPGPYPEPQSLPAPLPTPSLAFEVESGIHPHMMVRLARDYLARTVSPDQAGQIVDAQVVP